jgi:hypothetical protein
MLRKWGRLQTKERTMPIFDRDRPFRHHKPRQTPVKPVTGTYPPKRRWWAGIGLLTALMLLSSFASPAQAASNCLPIWRMTFVLVMRYGEHEVDRKVVTHQSKPGVEILLQVWANTDTGTWTYTGTGSDGHGCVYASGSKYSNLTVDDLLLGGVKL